MRPFEILIALLLVTYLTWSFLSGIPPSRAVDFLPLLAAIIIVFHLASEGYRWQMVPLYLLAGILLMGSILALVRGPSSAYRFSWSAAGRAGTLVLLALSTALPALLPVPAIPPPGGRHQVGTQTFILTDAAHRELFSGKDEPRKFMIQVWYPADPSPDTGPAPWMQDASVYGRAIATYLGLPKFFLDHLALVKTPAWQDSPLKSSIEGFPIILFSHGWNGFAAQNTGQALELASQGYVVVALQHTYGAVVTVFPDGKVADNGPSALPEGMPEPGYTEAARKLVNQWSGDISFALDFMTKQNEDPVSPLHSSLDLTKVGVYGHSTGGGAAIQFCGTDSRCKALLGMDPFMTPVSQGVLENGVPQPALFMFSQRWADEIGSKNNRLFGQFYENLKPATRVIFIQGTSHYDFSDLPLLSPIAPQLRLKGTLNGKRVTRIVDDYLISFFNSTLKDQPADLLSGPSSYPEVKSLY